MSSFIISKQSNINEYRFIQTILLKIDFIFFWLWIIGFLIFIMTLEKGMYKKQFQLFGWNHIVLLFLSFTESQVQFIIYKGLIWLLFVNLIMASNDISAYLVGINYGKTPLIILSPNKTVEGFIGAAILTFFFSYLILFLLININPLLCEQNEITLKLFSLKYCEPNQVFQTNKQDYYFFSLYHSDLVNYNIIFNLFCSFIAPFAGFFASGLKRSNNIKDFNNVIPGHGGITDRLDCHLLTVIFTSLMIKYVILKKQDDFQIILNLLPKLSLEEIHELKLYLQNIN